jgi:hypothetical protein
MTKQVWLPSSADSGSRTFVGVDTSRQVIDRCHVPTGPDTLCGFPIFEGESPRVMERHIRRCVSENEAHIHAARNRAHPDILKPWDTEFHAWVQKHREALIEGRKRA